MVSASRVKTTSSNWPSNSGALGSGDSAGPSGPDSHGISGGGGRVSVVFGSDEGGEDPSSSSAGKSVVAGGWEAGLEKAGRNGSGLW